jgi:hypothetical protein
MIQVERTIIHSGFSTVFRYMNAREEKGDWVYTWSKAVATISEGIKLRAATVVRGVLRYRNLPKQAQPNRIFLFRKGGQYVQPTWQKHLQEEDRWGEARSCRQVHTKMVPISFWRRWHPHLESSQQNKNPHWKTSILTYMIWIPHNFAWLFSFALQSKSLQITACHLPYISFYQCCQCNWNS